MMRSLDMIIQHKSPQVRNFLLMNRMAGKGVTKVVNKCQEAQEDQNLDLSECMLISFPDAVYHLMRSTKVLTCNLSCNQLRKVPPKLALKFSYITDLNLSHNLLGSLPDELKDMPDLEKLDLSHNDFILFPRILFSLPRISSVDLSRNKLMDADAKAISRIKTLKDLNLNDNPLSKEVCSELEGLKTLSIHFSRVEVDPLIDFDDLE